MQFQIPIQIQRLEPSITYQDKMLLIGSCFTEHIGNYLSNAKFTVLQNPNGILFDPLSVCRSLINYIDNKRYTADDLFYHNEAWHSWQHHSRFSHPNREEVLQRINASQHEAHHFLKEADWIFITLGSSFAYQFAYTDVNLNAIKNSYVANCHKASQKLFNKNLCTIEETVTALDGTLFRLFHFNPKLKIIFTISPVRHLRDGVIENNRSKARLLEAVHHLVNKFSRLHYFPAYELVVDVLRDYRFYDVDMAHPNYAATQFVLEHFFESCVDANAKELSEKIKKVMIARNHKPFNPASQQHRQFLASYAGKVQTLQQEHPYLNLSEELRYFST